MLARHAAADLDEVDEIHVARLGTGGPACARLHHRALGGAALDWRDGGWLQRQGGSGRELCWFPDPVGAADCYRASLPDVVNLTYGINFELNHRAVLTTAFVTPVTGPKPFDFEALAFLNIWFGPTRTRNQAQSSIPALIR